MRLIPLCIIHWAVCIGPAHRPLIVLISKESSPHLSTVIIALLNFAAQCSESTETNSIPTDKSTVPSSFLIMRPIYLGTFGLFLSIRSFMYASFSVRIFFTNPLCASVSLFLSHQSCHSNSVRKDESKNPSQNSTLFILTLYPVFRASITSFLARSMPSISSFGFGSVSPFFIARFTASEYSTHWLRSSAIPDNVPDHMRSICNIDSIGHVLYGLDRSVPIKFNTPCHAITVGSPPYRDEASISIAVAASQSPRGFLLADTIRNHCLNNSVCASGCGSDDASTIITLSGPSSWAIFISTSESLRDSLWASLPIAKNFWEDSTLGMRIPDHVFPKIAETPYQCARTISLAKAVPMFPCHTSMMCFLSDSCPNLILLFCQKIKLYLIY